MWGKFRLRVPAYVRLAGTLSTNLSALVMLQGLFAYMASDDSAPKAESSYRRH